MIREQDGVPRFVQEVWFNWTYNYVYGRLFNGEVLRMCASNLDPPLHLLSRTLTDAQWESAERYFEKMWMHWAGYERANRAEEVRGIRDVLEQFDGLFDETPVSDGA